MMDYETLAQALTPHGITAQIRPNQLVISAQHGPVWPNRGNSFWVHEHDGVWYICTWTPYAYRLPPEGSIASLCLECMSHGTTAMYRVPEELIDKYQLAELSEAEMDDLLTRIPDD